MIRRVPARRLDGSMRRIHIAALRGWTQRRLAPADLHAGPQAVRHPGPRTDGTQTAGHGGVGAAHARPEAAHREYRRRHPDRTRRGRARVSRRGARTANVIVPGILDLIEQPELVIIDLSRGRPNVTYEAALVHALGLPHVLITEDRRPPFYFQPVERPEPLPYGHAERARRRAACDRRDALIPAAPGYHRPLWRGSFTPASCPPERRRYSRGVRPVQRSKARVKWAGSE